MQMTARPGSSGLRSLARASALRMAGGALFLCALALFATTADLARAADPTITLGSAAPGPLAGWEESLGLEAAIDDSVDGFARVFDSSDYQRQLLLPGRSAQAYLLGLKDLSVTVFPLTAIVWTQDDLPAVDLSKGKDGGKLAKLGGEVTFSTDGGDWTIRPAPALVGALTLDALKKAKPDYVRLAAKYSPDPNAVKAIGAAKDTRIVVFFGSWCLQCKKYVPQLLQVLDAAKNPALPLEIYGVTEDHLLPNDPIVKYSITTTPTIIVMRGGKELGRITEKPDVSIEKDLALIMAAK